MLPVDPNLEAYNVISIVVCIGLAVDRPAAERGDALAAEAGRDGGPGLARREAEELDGGSALADGEDGAGGAARADLEGVFGLRIAGALDAAKGAAAAQAGGVNVGFVVVSGQVEHCAEAMDRHWAGVAVHLRNGGIDWYQVLIKPFILGNEQFQQYKPGRDTRVSDTIPSPWQAGGCL